MFNLENSKLVLGMQNPIKTKTKVWVLHPKFPGKVVAEALVGVNRKSRCLNSANEICKEGQQMILVVCVLYKNTHNV